ncbi:MAG: coniferyl aldehyde dehydrogenase [Pseudomonadota bacterium]
MSYISLEDVDRPSKVLEGMRAAHNADPAPTYEVRKARLDRLEKALNEYADRLVEAMQQDFSHRSQAECDNFDVTASIGDVRNAKRHLKKWMKTRNPGVPKHLMPAKARVAPQPLGVIGIISPWNFPVFLAIGPMAAALAAGNRVMLKPSELSPRTSEVMTEMLHKAFEADEVRVFNGGPEVASKFSELPFDHLLFTGSTSIGRKVAAAAAPNLTPVTLELGGKSPAIITPSANMDRAAERIAFGKTANAGQICVAPDYALVPRDKVETFLEKVQEKMRSFYPTFAGNKDYTAMITDRHLSRARGLIANAEENGARVIRLEEEGKGDPNVRQLAPAIVVDPPLETQVMQEEIFGPVLAVIPYDDAETARRFVMERDRPLALYIFGENADEVSFWRDGSISGGVCVNEVLFHVACDTLPFGGVGPSGMGSYHGDQGFETFSHMKPIFIQSKLNGASMFNPPFTEFKAKMGRIFRKII